MMANGYALTFGIEEQSFFRERAKTIPIDWLQLRSGLVILDVGCGTGDLTARIARHVDGGKVYGIDSSPEFIAVAQQLATSSHLNLKFILADAHALPFESHSFDLVYTHTVLMHLSAPEKALQEMVRVTRIGGLIVALGEGNWETVRCEPACEALNLVVKALLSNIQRQGGDPFLGKRLASLFQQVGLGDIEVRESPSSYIMGHDLLQSGYLNLAKPILEKAAAEGFVYLGQMEELLRKIRAWCSMPGSTLHWPKSISVRGCRLLSSP